MDVLKHYLIPTLVLAPTLALSSGCSVSYVGHTAYNQAKLFFRRTAIEKVLADSKTPEAAKAKLRLAQEAKEFAEKELGLNKTKNYTQFVQLDGPYVSYIVHAAPVFKLESHQWWFPIVGHVPYKGYFKKELAEEEAGSFKSSEFDTYVRGVSAFSTLGWFKDPLYSSMLAYDDHDLVNTVIHETVHATIYFKNHGGLNERMATFLGDYGSELFFTAREGKNSPTAKGIREEREDQKMFSQFLSREMAELRAWYKSLAAADKPFTEKEKRLQEIQNRFSSELKPKLKTGQFAGFTREPLNNARLLALGTYYEDLGEFERLRDKLGPDFRALVAYLKNLAKSPKPETELKAFAGPPPP
jgi:predicted aminopeptidase